jgi:hypothetical protein
MRIARTGVKHIYENNIMSVTSTLPTSNTRTERQLELLFGLGATLFSLKNYIHQSRCIQHASNKEYPIHLKLNPYLWNSRKPSETPGYWSGKQPLSLPTISKIQPANFGIPLSRHNIPNQCYLGQISLNHSTTTSQTAFS